MQTDVAVLGTRQVPQHAVPAFPGKYLSVTTFKRDGTPVATPVWFVQDGGRLLIETESTSGKVKRIRHNPEVLVAPCTASGKLRGDQVSARAEILGEDALPAMRRIAAEKYRVDRVLVLPIFRAVQALSHKGTTHGAPVVVAFTVHPGSAG
jgi:uncharacterized protein